MLQSRFLPSSNTTKHFVVLLHAFPLSSMMWERMSAHLQSLRDDVALLLIDFPGFGDSLQDANWGMASASNEIRAIIQRHTKEKIIVAGLSMGGYAVFEFYRMNPGLVR